MSYEYFEDLKILLQNDKSGWLIHCKQFLLCHSIELALKSILSKNKVIYKNIHDLNELFDQINEDYFVNHDDYIKFKNFKNEITNWKIVEKYKKDNLSNNYNVINNFHIFKKYPERGELRGFNGLSIDNFIKPWENILSIINKNNQE
jgi:hypothetical protein